MGLEVTILTGVLLIMFGILVNVQLRIKKLEARIGVTDTRIEVVSDDQRDSIQLFRDEIETS